MIDRGFVPGSDQTKDYRIGICCFPLSFKEYEQRLVGLEWNQNNVFEWSTCLLAHGEGYLIQQYVIKFVSDLRQVGGFLQVLRFPPAIKLSATT